MQCILGGDDDGTLFSVNISGGLDDEALPMIIHNGAVSGSLDFDSAALGDKSLHTTRGVPGYSALIGIGASEAEGCFGLTGGGRFKMRQVWQGEKPDEQLFEGSFLLATENPPTIRSRNKRAPPGSVFRDHFWAVRALKDEDGEEIGIDHLEDEAMYEDVDDLVQRLAGVKRRLY